MKPTKLAVLLSALLLLAIVGAGCGDDEEPAGSTQESGTATQEMTSTDEASTGADDEATEAEDDADSGNDDDSAGADAGEDAVTKVAIAFLEANFEGDGDRACALANAKGKASINAASTTSTCAEAIEDSASLWQGAKAGEPDEVEVEGNRATVQVPLNAPFPAQRVVLQREGGTWKIADRENIR